MSKEQEQIQICNYLIRRLENELSPQEESELKAYLQNDPEGIALYISVANLYAQLSIPNKLNLQLDETEPDVSMAYMDLLKELGEDEKKAESIVPLKENPSQSLIEHVLYPPREKRRISKLSLFSLAFSTAAVIFMILFIRFAPPKSGPEVATLTDSINAKWADADMPMSKDMRLTADNTRFMLREGLVELCFDNETKVTLEAPAEFQIPADDQIRLFYGRIYATVPQGAIGFTVNTPSARIIDLGTEFGVEADFRGDTSLHVMKGKTMLIGGNESNKASVEVKKGIAKKVSSENQAISDISYNDRLFARNIDSSGNLVWRGETEIDLADIVGGGNGFQGGTLNTGIDVTTGKKMLHLADNGLFTGSAGYRIVDSSPYIDGVFFPGTADTPEQITSDPSMTVQFPKTSGTYWGYVFDGAFHYGIDVPKHDLKLNGMVFGRPETPAITIHSNQGITFDLSEIRREIPEGKMSQFRSLIGISETVQAQAHASTAVFWVFLDGRKVCEQKMTSSDKAMPLEVPITAADRFLTLAVTESDDGWGYDWTLFGRPELMIELAR